MHILCDPVKRSFSHFLHLFRSNKTEEGFFRKLEEERPGEIDQTDIFERTIENALKNLLSGKDISELTDDETRVLVKGSYFKLYLN